jgi:hypothetical protein
MMPVSTSQATATLEEYKDMKRVIIRTSDPGCRRLSQVEVAEIAKASNEVVANLAVPYDWATTT